jgi:hypothetical protein
MMSAQIAAGIVVRFTPHVGGCWKILERRLRVESKLLCKKRSHRQILPFIVAAGTNVPPLHHDEGKEVHTLRFVQ